jgi:hypothetical protein
MKVRNGTKSKDSCLPSPMCAREGLFIGEIKGLITMPEMPLITCPANIVYIQGGNPVYYIK